MRPQNYLRPFFLYLYVVFKGKFLVSRWIKMIHKKWIHKVLILNQNKDPSNPVLYFPTSFQPAATLGLLQSADKGLPELCLLCLNCLYSLKVFDLFF